MIQTTLSDPGKFLSSSSSSQKFPCHMPCSYDALVVLAFSPRMDGFVQEHGKEQALELLQGSGLPKGYKNRNESAWTIMFLDEILGMNNTKGNDIRVAFDTFVRDFHNKKKDGGDASRR
jgi:hypothetical protein